MLRKSTSTAATRLAVHLAVAQKHASPQCRRSRTGLSAECGQRALAQESGPPADARVVASLELRSVVQNFRDCLTSVDGADVLCHGRPLRGSRSSRVSDARACGFSSSPASSRVVRGRSRSGSASRACSSSGVIDLGPGLRPCGRKKQAVSARRIRAPNFATVVPPVEPGCSTRTRRRVAPWFTSRREARTRAISPSACARFPCRPRGRARTGSLP